MTFKEKLTAKKTKLEERKNQITEQLIKEENAETRAALGATLKALKEDIDEVEEMLKTVDEPAAPAAASKDPEGDPAARANNPVAAASMHNGASKDPEARAKAFAASGHMSISNKEARSTLLSTGTIAKPTGVGGINDPANTVSSIVDMVRVEDMTGMGAHKEAFITAWQTAGALTDGTAPTGTDPTFKTCNINPFLLGCVSYVSRELKKQTPLLYEAKVREGALIALKAKLAEWIVSGGGTNEIYGIINAVNTDNTPGAIYETLDMTAAIGADTLRKIVFAYGGDENVGANAVLVLNKKDLIAFGDVRGTNEKKAVYEIIPDGTNPNTGIIKDGGLAVPYVICSKVKSFANETATSAGVKTMIYGDLKNYKLGLFGNYEVNVSDDYKFGEGLLTVRGEVMVGGNVVVDKGFVVVNKKTAS